jgi:hypothetical protein
MDAQYPRERSGDYVIKYLNHEELEYPVFGLIDYTIIHFEYYSYLKITSWKFIS